jgi:multidrug efflux pump subunit AcrA (membrane-fusion protein)
MPRYLCLTFPIVMLLTVVGCGRQQPIQAKQDAGPIAIETAAVAMREVQRVVESVGTLFPYDESVVSAEIDGRVDQVKVDLGDNVTAG